MAQISEPNGHNPSANMTAAIDTIIQALEIVHSPSSSNDSRRQATIYLEDLKNQNGVTDAGYKIASDTSKPAPVRYYGLSLLEHVIKRQSFVLNAEGSSELRQLILNLSMTLDETHEPYIRNKIAALWVELSKRSWALDWFDLDAALLQIWTRSDTGKEFVLHVLENLSEDVFVRDDATAILRDKDLNNAVVEIFTSSANYTGGLKVGDTTYQMREGEEGWIVRITRYFNEILQQLSSKKDARRLCLLALATLRSTFSWIMTPAIVGADAMTPICEALTRDDADVVLAALDTLLALYSRRNLEWVEIQALVHPLCHPGSVLVLEKVYKCSIVGADDILDAKYVISKKLSELLFHLTAAISIGPPPDDTDVVPFLKLLVAVAQHTSLIVSIAAIHSWDKVLHASSDWRQSSAVQACLEEILQVAMQRIIAYDSLPTGYEDEVIAFVHEEIELHPERQGFFLNYRKLCFSIVEGVSATYLQDALTFILTNVDKDLDSIWQRDQAEDHRSYMRLSANFLRADALFSVVDAAFKGVDKFTHQENPTEDARIKQREGLLHRCKDWTTTMLSQRRFRDPSTTLRQIKNAVETSSRVLRTDTEFAFTVLQHIIASMNTPPTENAILSDGYSELHQYACAELRRLCTEHATYFITFYDQLEAKMGQIIAGNIDPKLQTDLKAILLLLVEHATGVDPSVRQQRIQAFIQPLLTAWEQQTTLMSSFDTFAQSQAFDQIGPFMASIGASNQGDWSSVPLNTDAQQIQTAMTNGAHKLPLRETRVLLSLSTDRVDQDSELYRMLCETWTPLLQPILTSILRLIDYNHRLHDPTSWPNVPPGQEQTIRRILRDRYWQSGISGGSMGDFHAQVKATKMTLEGFASSVRGRIRTNLENSYSIIHTLGRLGSNFYGLQGLPKEISRALLESTRPLSPHHFGQLLSMLPKLIEECPPDNMQDFLTPVLAELVAQMDAKCTTEWAKISARSAGVSQENVNGELSDEMRDESVLRQMTSRAVNIINSWLDNRMISTAKRVVNKTDKNFRSFVLSSPPILEPLLQFCTHSLSFRDTKTCNVMVHALLKFVPAFSTDAYLQGSDAGAVREYISSEMLKAAINSLNDGYFADYHQHLATLIALIYLSFGLPAHVAATETQPAHDRSRWTSTPYDVLCSIPGIKEAAVQQTGMKLAQMGMTGKRRTMSALILNLLEDFKGVRVSELGKYDTKQERSGLLEKYKQRDALGMQGVEDGGTRDGGAEIDLGGVADMFST